MADLEPPREAHVLHEYELRFSTGLKDAEDHFATPLSNNARSLLLSCRQLSADFEAWFFSSNTFRFACYPSEILNNKLLSMNKIAQMKRVQFSGPAVLLAGRYELTYRFCWCGGSFSAEWEHPFESENACWSEIFDFLSERMNLVEVSIGFEDVPCSSNKIEPGENYLWHVARKMASLWMEEKFARLFIFQPALERCGRQFQHGSLIRPAKIGDLVRIMCFPWHAKDTWAQHRRTKERWEDLQTIWQVFAAWKFSSWQTILADIKARAVLEYLSGELTQIEQDHMDGMIRGPKNYQRAPFENIIVRWERIKRRGPQQGHMSGRPEKHLTFIKTSVAQEGK
ncbi:hypothetical protein FKW77_005755 [Venturia effusa]|uniref:Uncharacterized protein n=1 Tax=Venturia effusa TaxID=50376 RepID=A0A517LQ78_9PEZI|nr:hypothetical protein FKW77_005755 [Venturia effusa]